MAKWYYKKMPVITSLLLVGPFAFPLLWKSSEFSLFWKIFLTGALTFLTVYCVIFTWKAYTAVWDDLKKAGLI